MREISDLDIILFNVSDVANFLELSKNSVRKLFHQKRLRGQKIGNAYYTTKENLQEFIKGRRAFYEFRNKSY